MELVVVNEKEYDSIEAVKDGIETAVETTDNDVAGGDHAESTSGGNRFKNLMTRMGFVDPVEDDDLQTPHLGYWELFLVFLWFGCRAFGGPVAQIQMMKHELVTEKRWVSADRFMRVYSVYQILPGPEATELACYFGYISRGRIGSIIGGLGFVLPGLCGMFLLSYLYDRYGLDNKHVVASFRTTQLTTAAMVFRATYKLSESALMTKSKTLDWEKGFLCLFCFLTSIIYLNFFIALGVCGVINCVFHYAKSLSDDDANKRVVTQVFGYFISVLTIGFYGLYIYFNEVPSENMIGGAANTITGNSIKSLFELGLLAGMVTFGGAYTTLPFIYAAAVTGGGWLTERQFLDAIALTNMMPTPLVTFVTVIGWIGNGFAGSVVIVIGIFLPAFSFTLIGHHFFEKVVENKFIEPFLDGVAAAVIGLLLYTSFQFLKNVIETALDTAVFLLAFMTIFYFKDKYTQPVTIVIAAMAGQILNMYD